MKITLLGTGTSTGVPIIGCTCAVCTSPDPHDRRLRCSAMVETERSRILIDCGPDFRQQMLQVPFRHIDAIFITHEHADHVGGIDDLRPYSVFGDVSLYADDFCATHLEERLPYCLKRNSYPGVPQLRMNRIAPHESVLINDLRVTAIQVMHGKLPILGYRINDFAYITDMLHMPETEYPQLDGVRVAVVNALRHAPHPTHHTLEQAIAFCRQMRFERVYFTHISHDLGLHAAEQTALPDGFTLGYDTLSFECP